MAVKQTDRQASRILKMRSSKPKNFGIPLFRVAPGEPVGALLARRGFAAITGPRVTDYIPQRMRGMAMDSFCALEYIKHYNTMRSIGYNG